MNVIEVVDLKKEFSTSVFQKKIRAVDGLSFQVGEGKIVGFLGANGAGKTTTIKTLLGLIRPSSGSVSILGGDPSHPSARAQVGFLPERPYFYEYLTGLEFLRFYAEIADTQLADSDLVKLLQKVGLGDAVGRQLRHYSKGMLQRVGLSQAIVHKPKLLILDEPMSGLDPDGRADIARIIREAREEGATVFLSSHQLHDIEVLCDEVVMIEKGRLILQSPVGILLEKESQGFEITFRTAQNQVETTRVATEELLQRELDQLRSRSGAIIRVVPVRPSLEEIFLKYKKGAS